MEALNWAFGAAEVYSEWLGLGFVDDQKLYSSRFPTEGSVRSFSMEPPRAAHTCST
jgi:hypothetical protein